MHSANNSTFFFQSSPRRIYGELYFRFLAKCINFLLRKNIMLNKKSIMMEFFQIFNFQSHYASFN